VILSIVTSVLLGAMRLTVSQSPAVTTATVVA
jgi:hypothetical protein